MTNGTGRDGALGDQRNGALRVGILSDTHVNKRGELWPQVFDAFAGAGDGAGVDAILHAGDVFSPHLLDELAAIAPVTVARGNGDYGTDDPRLRDEWSLEFGGVTVAMLHDFPSPARRGASFVQAQADKRFPAADVLICGHTHIAELHALPGLLWLNPGSPTLPDNKSKRLGTIALLTIIDGVASAELWQLTTAGHVPMAGTPSRT